MRREGTSKSEHFALRPQKRGDLIIRDRDRGEGGERVKARPRATTQKTEDAVDRRQNNKKC